MTEIDLAALSRIEKQLNGIRDWVADEAPHIVAAKARLDPRDYWHHCGYQAALRDVLAVIRGLYGKSEQP
jgi:hypothetical protein